MSYKLQVEERHGRWMDCYDPRTIEPAVFATRGALWLDAIDRARRLRDVFKSSEVPRYRIVKQGDR